MAKKTTGPKTIMQCACGATRFQGPFPVGEVIKTDNGYELETQEVLYMCRNCNKVQTTAEMHERVILEA